jgi:hypothetical protein
MKHRLIGLGLAIALLSGGAAMVVANGATAGASGTTHRLVQSSVQNFSAAFEAPKWTFTCDTQTTAWSFRIDDVQVMDSHVHPWRDFANGIKGPWHVGVFSTTDPDENLFSASATMQQNATNGLFVGKAHGTDPTMANWCVTGGGLTAFAFSGNEQPLLLDGSLS